MRGSARELAQRYANQPPRGEVALGIGAAPDETNDLGPALHAVRRLVQAGAKPRPAAAVVAELTGTSANALYRGLTTPPE